MSTAPTTAWQSVTCSGVFDWHSSSGSQWSGLPVALGSHSNTPVATFNVSTAGSVAVAITGTVTLGSNTITAISDTSKLAVGQAISGAGLPSVQGGSWLASINTEASSLVFRNGYMDVTTNDEPATASGTGVALTVSDPCPIGTLLASVSPSTGVVITDVNFDGPTDISYLGNGSAICNLAGFADGNFEMAFASAGTFVVECMYVTTDPNYSNVTVSPPITIVVT